MNFKELLEKHNLGMKQFSEYFKIPLRTVQAWNYGERKCPSYVLELIEFRLNYDPGITGGKHE